MRAASIIVILAIVVLAALGFLFKGYFDRSAAAEAASNQVIMNKAAISKLDKQNQTLKTQIEESSGNQAQTEAAIIAANLSIPEKMNSNNILHDVLDLCSKYSITGIPLSTSDWTSVQIQKRPYYVFKLSMRLTGIESNLIECVSALQSELYPTLVIENTVLSQAATAEEFPSADVSLAIYAR